MKKLPNLHIFLGAGGVGKTTLSASFALALAQSGKKVGLLSIDPAKRLQTAFAVGPLSEEGTSIPIAHPTGKLWASILQIEKSLVRWVEQKGLKKERQDKLYSNPYFSALAGKMATATDTLAAIRMAEWMEQYPDMDDFVIDTAPGIHAIDFILKPEKLMGFLDSKLVDWLKMLVGAPQKQTLFSRIIKKGAQKVIDGLAVVGGKGFLVHFGEFLILIDEIILTAMERLKVAQKWIFNENTKIFLVTSVRSDALFMTQEFISTLQKNKLPPTKVILNRCFPSHLLETSELAEFLQTSHQDDKNHFIAKYLAYYKNTQEQILAVLAKNNLQEVEIPISVHLDQDSTLRQEDLSYLGQAILQQSFK